MTSIADAQNRVAKRHARLILEAEMPECLQTTKRPFPEQVALWSKGMRFVDTWAKQKRSDGIILQGGTGRGKSELASLMLFMLADLHGVDSLYLNARDLDVELKGSYERQDGARSEYQILELAKSRQVICFDDAGGEGNENEKLHVKSLCRALIDLAAATNKLFIMTANLKDDGLATLLGDEREESRRAPWTRLIFKDEIPDYRRKARK